jgi:hypothetical protein
MTWNEKVCECNCVVAAARTQQHREPSTTLEALIKQGRTRVIFTAEHTGEDALAMGTGPILQRPANLFVFFQSFRLALLAFPLLSGSGGLEFGATNKLVHMIVEATLDGKVLLAKFAFQLVRRGAG